MTRQLAKPGRNTTASNVPFQFRPEKSTSLVLGSGTGMSRRTKDTLNVMKPLTLKKDACQPSDASGKTFESVAHYLRSIARVTPWRGSCGDSGGIPRCTRQGSQSLKESFIRKMCYPECGTDDSRTSLASFRLRSLMSFHTTESLVMSDGLWKCFIFSRRRRS